MQLLLPDETSFAQGATNFADHDPSGHQSGTKIFVPVMVESLEFQLYVEVDTGGLYLTLNRELAAVLKPNLAEPMRPTTIRSATGTLNGQLYKHRVTLLARDGESLDFEPLLFITEDWNRSESILGYSGALEYLRFAVDPGSNRFFFGPLQ